MFSLYACAADQFYITTLFMNSQDFRCEADNTRRNLIAKTYTSMKARDVKNENQISVIKFLSR